MTHPFIKHLHSPERPVIVFDGAMGTNLQSQNLTAEDFGGAQYEGCNEYLVHSKPELSLKFTVIFCPLALMSLKLIPLVLCP